MTVITCEYNKKYESVPFSIENDDKWTLLLIRNPVNVKYPDGKNKISSGFMLCSPECCALCTSDSMITIDRLVFMPSCHEVALMNELSIPFDRPVEVADLSQLTECFFNFYAEYMSSSLFRSEKIEGCFKILLYKLAEKYRSPHEDASDLYKSEALPIKVQQNRSHYNEFVNVREIFTASPEKQWTVDDIADEIGLSRSRTQHLYREYFGKAIINDIIESRINKARQLLNNTDLFVMDIAERSGFNSVSYFTGKFRQMVGMTPEQYRNSKRRKDIH